MIIISEGFSSYMNIKYHSSAYVIIYPMMLRGKKKKQNKAQKNPDTGFHFILWNVPESFVLWVNWNNIMLQLLKNKLNMYFGK